VPEILLVFCPQQAGEVEDVSAQLAKIGDVQLRHATNAQAGMALLRRSRYDLIVVGSHLASNGETAVADGRGLAFCVEARGQSQAPMVLMVPKLTSTHLKECNRIHGARVLPLDDRNELAETARDLLRPTGSPRVQLDITVTADENGWRYRMRGADFDFQAEDKLTVHRSAWMCWTDLHHSEDHWYLDFKKVGNSIRTCLCEENANFKGHMALALERAKNRAVLLGFHPDEGKVDHRLTFVVSKTYYPLVLEAIFDPSMAEPWLANARLGRRLLGSRSERGDLFQATLGPLRALLICADTSGTYYDKNIPNGKVTLSKLGKIRDECRRVALRLSRTDPETGRSWFAERDIHLLGKDDQPVTRRALMEKLKEGPWDLIHFAGHSYFRSPDNEGEVGSAYLFVGAQGEPEAIPFSHVASYLRGARFVYLSSCESGNSSFAAEASAAGIHTMMGYRWKVNDWTADLQARLFYRELLRHRSVDTAFWKARKCIYERYRHKQNTWASAMLVTPDV